VDTPAKAKNGKEKGKMMVDPFEVRMRFTTQLQHLSASVTSAQKAAFYALKYRDLDEDLHSCILEQLERVRLIQFTAMDLC
jgi:CTD kinase subunit gamma